MFSSKASEKYIVFGITKFILKNGKMIISQKCSLCSLVHYGDLSEDESSASFFVAVVVNKTIFENLICKKKSETKSVKISELLL